ncbi:MAG TPA: PIG-L family deacetylase [Anaerolineae bacterium]|nr:PIG-L family deacetylase [Anaerolineae bacterium]
MTNKLSLVAIFAHPDDEAFGTGGTLTKYASEGVDVHLIIATRGEAGRVANPNVNTVQPFGLQRELELRRACEIYGATLHLLGYIDGQTPMVPPAEAVFKIVKILRAVKPQVVIGFGPDGIYGHYDHLVAHRWASAAVSLAAEADRWPEAGPPHQVAKFYYRALPQAQVDNMVERVGYNTVDMGGVPFPFVGFEPEQITTVIDVQGYARQKLQAIRCHASQLSPETPLLQSDFDPLAHEWFHEETFILAQPSGLLSNSEEDDLFAGVR